MGSKGSQTTTSQSSSAPDPQAYAAYQQLLQRAQGVAQTPYQPYTGQLVAPVNSQQNLGISGVNQYAGVAQPTINAAINQAQTSSAPLTAAGIQQYMSPYTQNVVNATQAQFNNQNQQQLQNVRGNAIAQGALGGNREAIAEAETAHQQQLAQAPIIANLYNQGYGQAVNTAMGEQGIGLQGAGAMGNLGVAGQSAGLQGAQSQIGAGNLQQNTQQMLDQALLQQYQQAQAFPYQQTQWLAGLDTGVGSQMGGTSSGQTTAPSPSTAAQIGGGLASGVGLLGATGAFGSAGWLAPALMALKRGGAVHGVAYPPVPESIHTLVAQQKQLLDGHRVAQLYPKGHPELRLPRGLSRAKMPNGDIFHYDPKKITKELLIHASKTGQENKVLGLGPVTKHDAIHRVASGEYPIAVVERNRFGHEVRAAAGTHATAQAQLDALNANKSPGHHVSVERPDHTIARRSMGGGISGYDTGGGVVPYPYGGGPTWIPAVNIAHGSGAPRASAPSISNQNQSQQAAQIGQMARALTQGINGADNYLTPGSAIPGDIGPSSVGGPNGPMPLVGAKRGGAIGVGGYADGGVPEDLADAPASFADRFNAVYPNTSMDGDDGTLPDDNVPASNGVAPTGNGNIPNTNQAPTPSVPPANATPSLNPTLQGVVPPSTYNSPMSTDSAAISSIESGGNYRNLGPVIDHGAYAGDRAYGKYQIMGNNIPEWTKEATGTAYTPQQFLNNPKLQDLVFQYKFGQYNQKYGPDGAARAWFAGEGNMNNPNAQDQLGTTVADYQNKFDAARGVAPSRSDDDALAFSDKPTSNENGLPSEITQGYSDFPTSQTRGVAPTHSSPISGIDWSANSKLWPALMSAGFGMMSSRSPFLGVAVGEGGQAGLATYGAEQQREAEAQKLALQMDLQRRQEQRQEQQQRISEANQPVLVGPDGKLYLNKQDIAAKQQLERDWQPKLTKIGVNVRGDDVMGIYDPNTKRATDLEGNPVTIKNGVVQPTGAAPVSNTPTSNLEPQAPNTPADFNTRFTATNSPYQQTASLGQAPLALRQVHAQAGYQTPAPPPHEGDVSAPAGSDASRDTKFLAGIAQQDPGYALAIQKAADYELDPSKYASMRKNSREHFINDVIQYDRNYQPLQVGLRYKAQAAFLPGTKNGDAVRSFNTAISHLDVLDGLYHALQNGNIRAVNRLRNDWNAYFRGEPLPNSVDAIGSMVANEVVSATVNSQGALGDREELRKTVTRDLATAQADDVINKFERLMGGKLESMKFAYENSTGLKNFDSKFLMPRSRQVMASLGQSPAAPQLAARDQQALDWANSHPNDPRAAQIKQKLGTH